MTSSLIFFISAGILVLFIGFFVGWLVNKKVSESHLMHTRKLAETIIAEAQKEAETQKKAAILEAKDEWYKAKLQFERETQDARSELKKLERRIEEKEQNVNRKVDYLEKREQELNEKHKLVDSKLQAISEKNEELNRILEMQNEKLEKIAGMSQEEAKKLLITNLENEARHQAAKRIKEIKDEAERNAIKQSREILTLAIERYAADHVVESTVSVVDLPNDEMKGRIIGREGRNIRAFENATGIDVIIDDTPEAVILSGFDPIRREIARLSLHKLVTDGRIHPARIEEVVNKTKKQLEQEIIETGKRVVIDLGIHGMHHELIRMIGRMKYRSSYGQNLLQHSIETANLCATMAAELGLNPKMAKRAGLLHDIGKVPDNEPELPHAILGMKLAEKYKENPVICNAIGAHHDEVEMTSLIAPIIQICDSISGARPGARREVVEAYIQRLNELEKLALSYPGVIKTYAIQAGRELRVIVGADKVSDTEANQISYDLSRKIQDEMTYPGQIKVTVIRETRAINYAK